jgi:hypothetical protein
MDAVLVRYSGCLTVGKLVLKSAEAMELLLAE